jgi:hypothetical protein
MFSWSIWLHGEKSGARRIWSTSRSPLCSLEAGWYVLHFSKSQRMPRLTEIETVWHAHRINPHPYSPERHHGIPNPALLYSRGIRVARTQVLRLPNEPYPRSRHSSSWLDDVLAPSGVNGSDDDPHSMGDSARWGCLRESCDLHSILPGPTNKYFAW